MPSASALVGQLLESDTATPTGSVHLDGVPGLPEPVARYLRRALRQGQPLIRRARLKQAGALRTEVRSARWLAFEADEVIAPGATGFVWDARVAIAPLIKVRVLDALIGGKGSGQVMLLSALRLAADHGSVEMTSGALHRYLAEAVWYPTALLPSARLRWDRVTTDKALATLTADAARVSLEFRFNASGEITGIYTPERWGRFNGRYEKAAWEGHFSDYREQAGMLVPTRGEVGWYSEGRWQCVWKGRITEMHFEFC